MDIFWFNDEVEAEKAQKYDREKLIEADNADGREPIILYNPQGPCDIENYTRKKQWIEIYSEQHFQSYDTTSWAKDPGGAPIRIISGFDLDVSLNMIAATTVRYMKMPRGAEDASILVINGPNLNLLGTREPHLYGDLTLAKIAHLMRIRHPKLDLHFIQSNSEGDLIDIIHNANSFADAIIINAGAYTHTSIAIHDALRTFDDVIIEAHITNPHQREDFRHISFIGPVSDGTIAGFGPRVYELALMGAMSKL